MTDFFRFPHTPHLAWLSQGSPRDDKVLSRVEVQTLLLDEVVVEEKLDGANIGFSLGVDGSLRIQNRGQYLTAPYVGQFSRLSEWVELHDDALRSMLNPELILFGEWCAARHSLDYSRLPDWFLLFDVYDRTAHRFWNTHLRNALAASAGLSTVHRISRSKFTEDELKRLVMSAQSRYRSGPLEGVVIRRESANWCDARAKLVQAYFSQSIDTHWRKRLIEWNRIDFSAKSSD